MRSKIKILYVYDSSATTTQALVGRRVVVPASWASMQLCTSSSDYQLIVIGYRAFALIHIIWHGVFAQMNLYA
jgi:hypothetical protein